jgi:UDP-GlcNAc:undecaprenyl-phosphate GlcNAc-1-phosphate transferase
MPALSSVAAVFVLAFAASVGLTALCRPLARRLGVVARPKADRWHREVVPLLGGVALACATIVAVLAASITDPRLLTLLSGGAAMFLVGLVDDVRPLKPQTKLTAELIVAAAVVAGGLEWPLTGVYWIDLLLSLFWLVGLTNAFNLLDNMDGLAAGIAAIAATAKLAVFLTQGPSEGAFLAAALIGATLGFLCFNFNPASIFMGDAGALFLGFVIGGLAFIGDGTDSSSVVSVLLFPLLLVVVPIFDTAVVTVNRLIAGRPISQGGRDHTSHRLVASGLSERQAALALYGLAAVSGLIAVYGARFGLAESVVALALFGLVVGILGVSLGRIGVYPESTGPENATWLGPIVDFSYTRQAAAFAVDLCLVALAYYAAYRLRFEQTFALEEPLLIESLPIVIAAKMVAFAVFRTYRGLWRYTSLRDLLRLAQAVTLGTVLAVLAVLFIHRFQGYSRALFVLDWLLLLVLAGASRVAFRTFAELIRPRPSNRRPVFIYGAGDGGIMVLRELRNNSELGREAVGFLDDEPSKQRIDLEGLRVLGGVDRLEEILSEHDVAEVVVSSGKISAERMAQLRRVCDGRGVLIVRSTLRLE